MYNNIAQNGNVVPMPAPRLSAPSLASAATTPMFETPQTPMQQILPPQQDEREREPKVPRQETTDGGMQWEWEWTP